MPQPRSVAPAQVLSSPPCGWVAMGMAWEPGPGCSPDLPQLHAEACLPPAQPPPLLWSCLLSSTEALTSGRRQLINPSSGSYFKSILMSTPRSPPHLLCPTLCVPWHVGKPSPPPELRPCLLSTSCWARAAASLPTCPPALQLPTLCSCDLHGGRPAAMPPAPASPGSPDWCPATGPLQGLLGAPFNWERWAGSVPTGTREAQESGSRLGSEAKVPTARCWPWMLLGPWHGSPRVKPE